MFSRPKILFLVSLLFVALLNSIPTYLLNFKFFIILYNYIEMVGVQVISQAMMSMIRVCAITENCFVNSSQGATMYI